MIDYSKKPYTPVEFYNEVVKKQWNLPQLLRDLNPTDSKRKKYLTADCPSCKKVGELYVYKDSGRMRCNRKNHCSFGSSVLEHATGISYPKGALFMDAVRILCEKAGIKVPRLRERESEDRKEEAGLHDLKTYVLEQFAEQTQKWLAEDADGGVARRYLHERGINDEAILKLGYGVYYSVNTFEQELTLDERDAANSLGLLQHRLVGYITQPMEDFGLRGFTFRYPAATPPNDVKKVLRSSGDGIKDIPCGLERAVRAKHRTVIAVEGQFDSDVPYVLADDSRVIATLGAGVTQEQAEKLKRYGIENVILLGDPDEAGRKANRGSIQVLTPLGIKVFVAPELPDGLDPDEFVIQRGSDDWRKHVDSSVHALRHLAKEMKTEIAEKGLTSVVEANVLKEVSTVLAWDGQNIFEPFIEKEFLTPLIESGIDKKFIKKYVDGLRSKKKPESTESTVERKASDSSSNFEMMADGLYMRRYSKDGEYLTRISDRFEITATVRSHDGMDWGLLLEFIDRDEVRQRHVAFYKMTQGDAKELREALANRGFLVEPLSESRTMFSKYLCETKPTEKARLTQRVGWDSGCRSFVLPDETFAASKFGERVILNPNSVYDYPLLKTKGTLDEWKKRVAAPCEGNSRAVLVLCVALSGPGTALMNIETALVNIFGQSSSGKTTLLIVAGSVWGGGGVRGFAQTWNSTSNSLENVCFGHNHICVCLDEQGQCDPKIIGEVIYGICNESPKNRQQRDGSLRKKSEWRLTGISTGELSAEGLAAEAGKRLKAGQQVRIVDIPADAGNGMGVFERTHSWTPQEFAKHLTNGALENYGVAGRALLKAMVDPGTSLTLKKWMDQFRKDQIKSKHADGQIRRVADRFALYAAVGEFAIAHGILPFQKGEAYKQVARCFHDWVTARGGWGNMEAGKTIVAVKSYLARYGDAQFPHIDGESAGKSYERIGFRKNMNGETVFLIFPEFLKDEILRGPNYHDAKKLLHDFGFMNDDKYGKYVVQHVVPGFGKVRLCEISSRIMDYDPEQSDESRSESESQMHMLPMCTDSATAVPSNVIRLVPSTAPEEKYLTTAELREFLLKPSEPDSIFEKYLQRKAQ